MRYPVALALPIILTVLTGCVSERHFARDSVWPFGNPNAPDNASENAERALGQTPAVTPIAPQAGNVWPGPVQPVPTIADIEKNMNQPLGRNYTPSLPSPYPPGQQPPGQDDDSDLGPFPPSAFTPNAAAPNPVAPDTNVPNPIVPNAIVPNPVAPGVAPPIFPSANSAVPAVPDSPHAPQ